MLHLLLSRAEIVDVFQAWWDNAILLIPQITMGIAVFVLGVLVAGLARRSAVTALTKATGDERAGNAYGTIVKYVVLLLALVVALAVAGVNLGAMMVAVGAVGFGLAFAMQDTISNLISGLIILTAHPFAQGDAVEVNGVKGKVEEISIRCTKLRSFDGLKIEVPNKAVLSNNITVLSYFPTRRWDVAVGVGYDDDITGAVQTAREAAGSVEGVIDDPAPEVYVGELGGSSVDLTVRFWTEETDRATMLQAKSNVTQRVKEALVDAGYDIPFPIRTIYMHEEGASNGDEPTQAAPESTPSDGR